MSYLIQLAILIGIYALLGLSLNLLVGYTGLASAGHASFFGVGAYTTAILSTVFGWNVFPTMLVGMGIAIALSVIGGSIFTSLSGDRYTLATLAFSILLSTIFLNWNSLTNGALGIAGIPRPQMFGIDFSSNASFLALVMVFVICVFALCLFLTRSSFGRVLQSIREDEGAIQVFGYHTRRYKQVIFAISVAIAALAGSLFASYVMFIDPSFFWFSESLFLLTLVILGGLASHAGSLLGAVVLILLPEAFRFIGFSGESAAQLRQGLYGVVLILLLFRRPQGLMGTYGINSS